MKSHICPWWIAFTFDNPLRKMIHPADKILSRYITSGMTVADIGCGMGYFSLAMARLVGRKGWVISVDLQPEMLARTQKRARRARLSEIIRTHRCEPYNLLLKEGIDFALAFWMVHEVPNKILFFEQMKAALNPGAALLITEPKLHVHQTSFHEELQAAHRAGFELKEQPAIAISWAALLV